MAVAAGKKVLMLAPSFLSDRRHKRIHGAEVFNLLLLRALVRQGATVTVGFERRWKPRVSEHLGDLLGGPSKGGGSLRVVYAPGLRKPLVGSLGVAAQLLAGERYDLLILGNVARGVLPAARLLLRARRAERVLVVAHQYVREDYLRALANMPAMVTCASEAVASDFRRVGVWPVEVSFGIQNPELFFPRLEARAPGPLRMCVVGVLDTPWKGVHLPLAAWDLLPERVRSAAELHLCAFRDPPAFAHPSIKHRGWVAPDRVGALLREMDVMIVPSTSAETFSQVMVQGMLTGLPQLVYNLGVLTEKLDAGGGAVFTDAQGLAELITRCVDDPAWLAEAGRVARGTAVARYVWDERSFVDRYLGLNAVQPRCRA